MTKNERNRANVRNWRARKEREGFVKLELYLHQDVIDAMPEYLDSAWMLGNWLTEYFKAEARR
jgi:hypothetical protein